MVEKANQVWADGPSSMPTQPRKSDIRAWGTWIESIIGAFFSTGGKIYQTRALLNADLTPAANSIAWVMEDPTVANNGIYRKVGGTGTGSWVRAGDLPFSFIVASNPGAGTPNAIQATTSIPVSSSALVILPVAATNTASPVTVSFNGGAALTIKTNSGNDVVAGGLSAGMIALGYVSGSTFRLASDQASAAIVAAAEGWANIAQAAANNNLTFVSRAAAVAANIAGSIHSVYLKGDGAEADGQGGFFSDVNNGATDTFTSADGRAWYRVTDVGTKRLAPASVSFPKLGQDIAASASKVLTVGSGGQYSSLNQALFEASKLRMRTYLFGGFDVEIKLKAGFSLAEQIFIKNLDLSWIKITSEDAEVPIVRSALTYKVAGGTEDDYPAFSAIMNAGLPAIDVLFNMDSSGLSEGRSAFYFEDRSHGVINAGKGCKNAGGRGIEARHNCNILANSAIFSGSLSRAIYSLHGSNVYAELANCDNCYGDYGVYALMGGVIMFAAGSAKTKQTNGPAIWANRGGQIWASSADASGSLSTNTTDGTVYASDGGFVCFDSGKANNCAGNAYGAGWGGVLDARNSEGLAAVNTGYFAFNGGKIEAQASKANGCGAHGYYGTDLAEIDAHNGSATGCGTGVRSSWMSSINFRSGVATGYTTRGVLAERGGFLNAGNANAQKAGANTSSDIVVLSNGKIDALGATGGLSQTANTIASAGLINQ